METEYYLLDNWKRPKHVPIMILFWTGPGYYGKQRQCGDDYLHVYLSGQEPIDPESPSWLYLSRPAGRKMTSGEIRNALDRENRYKDVPTNEE